MPETTAPAIDAFVIVKPQIIFFQQNYIDDISSIETYAVNAIYLVPNLQNLPLTVSTLHTSEAPILYQDQQLQEFLISEECCHKFITQDLTFLQPSTVYEMTVSDDSLSTASDSTDASVITVQENNPSQEVNSNSSPTLSIALSDDPISMDNNSTPVQLVEPVIGLTTEEQRRNVEDHNHTLEELLGLSSCEVHISMPLQILDGLYVNQPSCFLPLAQEARR